MAKIDGVQEVAIGELVPYEKNAKIHGAEQVELIAKSIKEFGFLNPILIDKGKNIIAGHGRLMAAKKLGMQSVPCIYVEGLSEEQYRAYVLADNRLTELGEWNMELVNEELEFLNGMDFDISLTGFELEPEVKTPLEIVEDDFDAELPAEPKAKVGDIYQLGNHRLMCGDSTSIIDLDQLLAGTLVECVCTDPPYNMAYEGAGNTPDSKRKHNRILNDKMSPEEFKKFLTDVYKTMYCGMQDGASCYVFYKEMGQGTFIQCMSDGGINYKQELVWVKNQLVLGGSKYQSMYEPCLFGCKGNAVKYWYGNRTQRSVIETIDLMTETELRDAIRALTESEPVDVIRERKPLVNDLHPTMKPIKLLAKLISNSTEEGHSVLDLFGGSGSTLMACEQLGRNCYMMELDPKYVDVIIQRWEEFTGKKAVLINE